MEKGYYQMIFKRKSFHNFDGVGDEKITVDELKDISEKIRGLNPLYKDIKTDVKILPERETPFDRGGEYYVMLYSEKKDGYLQNIGYIGEQLDLYLATKNIGALWYGLGKSKDKYNGLDFVITIAISKVDDEKKFRKDVYKATRKSCDEIWEGEKIDKVSDVVRFAPSACNSQPWLVRNENNELLIYRRKQHGRVGIMSEEMSAFFNRIDMGIFMCFLDVCLEEKGISFTKEPLCERETDTDLLLNAKYELG